MRTTRVYTSELTKFLKIHTLEHFGKNRGDVLREPRSRGWFCAALQGPFPLPALPGSSDRCPQLSASPSRASIAPTQLSRGRALAGCVPSDPPAAPPRDASGGARLEAAARPLTGGASAAGPLDSGCLGPRASKTAGDGSARGLSAGVKGLVSGRLGAAPAWAPALWTTGGWTDRRTDVGTSF